MSWILTTFSLVWSTIMIESVKHTNIRRVLVKDVLCESTSIKRLHTIDDNIRTKVGFGRFCVLHIILVLYRILWRVVWCPYKLLLFSFRLSLYQNVQLVRKRYKKYILFYENMSMLFYSFLYINYVQVVKTLKSVGM